MREKLPFMNYLVPLWYSYCKKGRINALSFSCAYHFSQSSPGDHEVFISCELIDLNISIAQIFPFLASENPFKLASESFLSLLWWSLKSSCFIISQFVPGPSWIFPTPALKLSVVSLVSGVVGMLEVKFVCGVNLTPIEAVGRVVSVGWSGIKLWIHCNEFVYCWTLCL